MCAMRKKSFKQHDGLKMHLHTHTGWWPFTCGILWQIFQAVWCLGGAPTRLYTLWQFICDIYKNMLMVSDALKFEELLLTKTRQSSFRMTKFF